MNSYYEKFIATGEVKCIDEEIPFEIPQGWEWERWGNISQSIQYGYNAPALEKGVIRMVRISDIQDNKVVWDTVPFCMIEEQDIETYLLEENDILFARTGGTVGKSFLVEEVPLESIYAGYLIRTRYSSLLCPHYMKAFMESQLYWEQLKNGTIATAQPNCNGKTLAKMLLPIPPINEQKRIIEKLHRISSLVERYSKSQDALNLINTQIYDQLRKSILQYAIQGQLVPQLESEGNAEKLLEQIRQEKLHLVEEGKLKKSALTDSVIYKGDDNKYYERIKGQIIEIELPFEYPNNWVVLRLKDVCLLT
ncbi:MAG: restriction endonuclease subunit S, partial [Parabacteroides johnsonii]